MTNMKVIQRFRIDSHSKMLIAATRCFVDNYDGIMDGSSAKDLMKESETKELRIFFEKLTKLNFNHPSVLKGELVGQRALKFHLETFFDPIMLNQKNSKSKEGKLLNLVSQNYLYVKNKLTPNGDSDYSRMLLLTDFISGMTDNFALKLFHELSGIEPY